MALLGVISPHLFWSRPSEILKYDIMSSVLLSFFYIQSGEKQLRVSVDDNIILRCTVTGFINGIRWEKNRNEITGANERFQIQQRTVDGDMLSSELVIRGIQADEQGRYKCWSGDTVATVKIIIRGLYR